MAEEHNMDFIFYQLRLLRTLQDYAIHHRASCQDQQRMRR